MMITSKFADEGEKLCAAQLFPVLNCKIKRNKSSAPLKKIMHMILTEFEKNHLEYEAGIVGSYAKCIALSNKKKVGLNQLVSSYDDIDLSIGVKTEGNSSETLLIVARIIQKIWGKENAHLKNPLFFSPDYSLLVFSFPLEIEKTPIQLSVHALTSLDQPTFLSNETSFAIPIKLFKKGIGSLESDNYFIYSKAGPYQQVLKDVENGRISSNVAPFVHGRGWFRILKSITVESFAFLPAENNRDLFKKDAPARERIIQNMNACAKEKKMREIDLVFYAFNALFACLSAEQILPSQDTRLSHFFIENIFLQCSFLKENFSWIFPLINRLQESHDPKIKIALFKAHLPLFSNKIELKIQCGEVHVQCSFKVYGKVYYVLTPLLSEDECQLIEETSFSRVMDQYHPKISVAKKECWMKILKLSGNEIDIWTSEEIKILLAVCQKKDPFYLSEMLISILRTQSEDVEIIHRALSSIHSFCPNELWKNQITIQSSFESMHTSMQIEEFSFELLFEVYDAILSKKPVRLCKLLKKISEDHPFIPKYLAILLIHLPEDPKKKKLMEEIEINFPHLWTTILQKIKRQSIEYDVIVFLSETRNHEAKRVCYRQLMDLMEERWEHFLEILPSLLAAATDLDKMKFVARSLDLLEKIPSLKKLISSHLKALKNQKTAFRNIHGFSVELLYNLLLSEGEFELALDLLEIFPDLQSLSNPCFCKAIKQDLGNQFLYIQYLEKFLIRINSDSLSQTLTEIYAVFSEIPEITDFLEKNYFLVDSFHAHIHAFRDPLAITKLLKQIDRYISDKKPALAGRLLRYLPNESPEMKKQIYRLLLESAQDGPKNKIAQKVVCQYFPEEWPLILEADVHPIHVTESIVSIIQKSSKDTRKKYFQCIEEKLCGYSTEIKPVLAELLLVTTDLEKWNCVKKRWILSENYPSKTLGKQIVKSISNPNALFQDIKFSPSLLSRTCDFFIEQELMSAEIADIFYMQMKHHKEPEKPGLAILSKIFPYLSQEVAEAVVDEQLLNAFSASIFFVKVKPSLQQRFPERFESIKNNYFSCFIAYFGSYIEHPEHDDRHLLFQEALECFKCDFTERKQKITLLTQCLTLKDPPSVIVSFFGNLIQKISDFDLLRDLNAEHIKTGFQILQRGEKAALHQQKPKEILEKYLMLNIENSDAFCLEFIKQNYWNYFNKKIKAALILKLGNLSNWTSIQTETDQILFIKTFLRFVCDPKIENDFVTKPELIEIFNKIALYCLSRKGDTGPLNRAISDSTIKKIIQLNLILFKKKITPYENFALFASFFHNSDIISDEKFKEIAQAVSFDYLKEKFKEHQLNSIDQKKLWFRVLEFKFRIIKSESQESIKNWLLLLQNLSHTQMAFLPTLSPAQFVDFYPVSFSMAFHAINYSEEIIERMVNHMIALRDYPASTLSFACGTLMKIFPNSEEGKNWHRTIIREVHLYRLNRNFQIDSDLCLYLQFLSRLRIEEGKKIEEYLKTEHLWFTNQTFGKLIQIYDQDTPFGNSMENIGEDLNIVGAVTDIINGRNPEVSLTSQTATKGCYWLVFSMWPQPINFNSILNFLCYIKQKHNDPGFLEGVINNFETPAGKAYSDVLSYFKTLIQTFIK